MGRTKRKRIRKKNSFSVVSLDSNASVISLKQWMTVNNWKNSNSLRLSVFETTGRGLTSPKQILKNDTLIEVPYELMISFTTLEGSYLREALLSTNKLKMHDLLGIFLAFEHHKGCLSEWKTYIDSLPDCVPPLPWLCSQEEIDSLPEELQSPIRERLLNFKSSWQRSKESINSRWICECCKTPGHCVLTLSLFTWAYVMVNTRAVYVDPNIVRGLSRSANNLRDLLSDDPSIALCPYLDMFNHSNKAATDAMLQKINDNKWMFRLVTTTPFDKYQEIFISYGSHDNIKLLCEYGFFIPNVELDKLTYDFSSVLKIVKCSVNDRQYQFIHKRNLHQELSVGANGVSFNLKAALFVIIQCDILDWSPYVFSESYSGRDKLQMFELAKQLVQFEIDKCARELCRLTKHSVKMSKSFENVLNYLRYKLTFTKQMMNHIVEEFM